MLGMDCKRSPCPFSLLRQKQADAISPNTGFSNPPSAVRNGDDSTLPTGSLLRGSVRSAVLSASVLTALTTAEQTSPENAHNILKYRLPKKQHTRGNKSWHRFVKSLIYTLAHWVDYFWRKLPTVKTCNHLKLFIGKTNRPANIKHKVFNSINHPIIHFLTYRVLSYIEFYCAFASSSIKCWWNHCLLEDRKYQAAKDRGKRNPDYI